MDKEIKASVLKLLRDNANEADGIYLKSMQKTNRGSVFAYRGTDCDYIVAVGAIASELDGDRFDMDGEPCAASALNHECAKFLRLHFPFTAPRPVLGESMTIGLGDRLGIATPGHIEAIEGYDVYPVFAQQSIRELTLTGRTYDKVLDDVTFGVFCSGYQKGFGADGDHLKTEEEVRCALASGYTMITLDCSQHIHNDVALMSDDQVGAACSLPEEIASRYLGKAIQITPDKNLAMDSVTLKRAVLIYGDALDFMEQIYYKFIATCNPKVDFEISIDETETPTRPPHHFFVANELGQRGVNAQSIAPRFCGEFQKGVNYIGDIAQFEDELAIHAAIAEHFGYKLSIHSGSDKFSVFPQIGRLTNGRFHLKTAGTSWLEAVRLVAMKDAPLFREVYQYSLERYADALKLYHISTTLADTPDIAKLKDEELPGVLEDRAGRQLLHVTYGYILTEKNGRHETRFAERLLSLWRRYHYEYTALLRNHIGKHLALLCSKEYESKMQGGTNA